MTYEKPKADVILFENSDVITASGIPGGGDDPVIPTCLNGLTKGNCKNKPNINH